MITCKFENGSHALLRHVVSHAVIEKAGKILLVKRAENLLEAGKWSLPAGYLNRDETINQCILREIQEETGWKCEIISLFRINTNPDRPNEDRQNVVFEFLVKPLVKIGEPDHESSKVEWVSINNLLPFSEFAFDHGETIKLYLEYRKNHFKIPILI
jgi:ADP-ribose pyrophosphatase YjhB (NUDIX family)